MKENKLCMEDTGSIALKAIELIENELRPFGIELTDEQEDLFFVPILRELEELSNCNYRHDH